MAKQQISGITEEEVEELESEFQDKSASDWYEFEERYCLYKIPYQPEDYDGPDRYCSNTASIEPSTGWYRCRFHKGRGAPKPENLTPGNPKHFMNATDEFLMEHLTEDEKQLYQDVLDWAELYGISEEEDPAAYDDLRLLAKQRVREVKASKYLFEEGEIREKFLRDEEGNVLLDQDGNPKTEDDTNVISEEYRRLINLIQSLKKDLIMTRREQAKADDRSAMAGSADTASKAMSELVKDDEKKFDVSEFDE